MTVAVLVTVFTSPESEELRVYTSKRLSARLSTWEGRVTYTRVQVTEHTRIAPGVYMSSWRRLCRAFRLHETPGDCRSRSDNYPFDIGSPSFSPGLRLVFAPRATLERSLASPRRRSIEPGFSFAVWYSQASAWMRNTESSGWNRNFTAVHKIPKPDVESNRTNGGT